ncbi:MAG: hypothetical protein ABI895_07390 [Deltaproteobacteria bacterium]
MRVSIVAALIAVGVVFVTGCKGGGKQEIPLSGGQTYLLQSTGKLKVYPSAGAQGAQGSQPLQKLQVKRKNDGAGPPTPGCWACTDCICNGAECACTECTSC